MTSEQTPEQTPAACHQEPACDCSEKPSPMVLKYFLLLFGISILLLGRVLWPFLSILVLSFLLAGMFQPVFHFFVRRLRFSTQFASLLTCGLIVLLVFVPLIYFIGALSKEALGLYQLGKSTLIGLKMKELMQQSALVARLQELLAGFGFDVTIEPQKASDALAELAKRLGLLLYNQASAWAANLMAFVFQFFMMIVVIFFLLIDHDRFVEFVLRLSPLPDDQERQLIGKFEQIAGAILIGNGICGLVQGVLGGIVFAVLGFSSPILWGSIMAVLAFLPIFGIGLVLMPAALFLLLNGKIATGIFVFIFYAVVSFSMEYLVKPKLVGEQIKMHTLLVFLGIMGGLAVFGVLGIIYGPLIVTGFLTLSEIYLQNYDSYVKNCSWK